MPIFMATAALILSVLTALVLPVSGDPAQAPPNVYPPQQQLPNVYVPQQQQPNVYRPQQEPSSGGFVRYRARDMELIFPETWNASENSGFIYVAPADGFDYGTLAYGIMISTFDPGAPTVGGYYGSDYYGDGDTFPSPDFFKEQATLEDVTNLVVAQFRSWNQNVGMVVNRGKIRVGGLEATVVDLSNESQTGEMQTISLVTVLRPNGLVTYFAGIAPRLEFSEFRPTFERVLASVRFL